MKALKCDVCDGYFDGIETIEGMPENKKPNRLQMFYKAHSGRMKGGVDIDICPECYKAIETALNNRTVAGIKKEDNND